VSLAAQIAVLWCWALALAVLEVEIEGAHGWAERLPTWFRTRGPIGRTWAVISGGRPATGYHLAMIAMLLLALHYPFAAGVEWSVAAEVGVIATYLAWVIAWDYLWFVVNPYYGLRRFRRGDVWWYPGPWIGRIPADYALAIGVSIAVAAIAIPIGGGIRALVEHLVLVGGLVVLMPVGMALAPLYRRSYVAMRRPGSDDRSRAGITPPPAGDADVFPWVDRER
jgi:hypothetical protein